MNIYAILYTSIYDLYLIAIIRSYGRVYRKIVNYKQFRRYLIVRTENNLTRLKASMSKKSMIVQINVSSFKIVTDSSRRRSLDLFKKLERDRWVVPIDYSRTFAHG